MTPKWQLIGIEAGAELSIEKAELVAGLKPSALNVMRCCDRGPAFEKLGLRVVYRAAAVEAWVTAQLVRTIAVPMPTVLSRVH